MSVVLVALLSLGALSGTLATGSAHGVAPSFGSSRVISYQSTVDRFPLSYLEWTPAPFDGSHSHPLVVYLHGMGPGISWIRGGVGGASVIPTLPRAAISLGALFISLNTRTDSGFYGNTVCGGPQEQDVLDAIAHEQAIRPVSEVYLIGFSMGGLGALSIAARHPALVSGVGVAAPVTDVFEEYSYMGSIPQLTMDLCGVVPSPRNSSSAHLFETLSPLRFNPTNFSGERVYVTAGGWDSSVPNNFSVWPFAQVNSTFVNASCARVAALGEPASCTQPISALHRLWPSGYMFRYVYEANAWHTPLQLNPVDLFGFLMGSLKPGFYVSNFPPVKIVPAP